MKMAQAWPAMSLKGILSMLDLLLLGGGLANGFIAWRLAALRPDLTILLVEKGATLGGNHTWSFYDKDVTPAQLAWLDPLIAHHWPGYEVRFPGHRRQLATACHSISSDRFHAVLSQALGVRVRLNATVSEVSRDGAVIDGKHVAARAVIDGRGYAESQHMSYAWQKFVGHEIELARPHGQSLPIIMDATVKQFDGYRFVYTLPLSMTRILVEDTYYSDSPVLDPVALRQRIGAYIDSRGWQVERLEREESGVLPVTLAGDVQAYWQDEARTLPCSGLRAGLFHATTGYSLPSAVRLADALSDWQPGTSAELRSRIEAFSQRQWQEQGFMRLLNRMMFYAGDPAQRYRILERFYTLPQALIERFYAGQLTRLDRLRILSGKPPVPVLPALRAAIMTRIAKPPALNQAEPPTPTSTHTSTPASTAPTTGTRTGT
jgi:lycopene beta-cyclase